MLLSLLAGMLPAFMPGVTVVIVSLRSILSSLAVMWLFFVAAPAFGQVADQRDLLADRPISEIRLLGLQTVTQQEVLNNIRSTVGDPYDPAVVSADVARLNRLGRFRTIEARGELQADGSVALIFEFVEQMIITELQVVGNKLISDQDLLAVVQQVPRGPRDDFLIQSAKRAIEQMYEKRGHYLATVTIDESELEQSGLLIFRIIEGPRVRIRAVEFEGNQAFTDEQLYAEIKTRTAVFLLRRGELDEEQLADDVAALTRFYTSRGYLDVRVGRQIELSPDSSEAKVIFVVAEGPQYTLRHVQVTTIEGDPLSVYSPQQIAALIDLKPGDVYSDDLLRQSMRAIEESYGVMGYLPTDDARRFYQLDGTTILVRPTPLRVADSPQVDLLLEVHEGQPYRVGAVEIQGNFLTRDRVVRRELRGITPGRPFDATQLQLAEDRLLNLRLFSDVRFTVQPEDPDFPGYRDVLVEVRERQTGSFSFGAAIGSDAGVFGEIALIQNNFDVTDFPESWGELFSGRAFRGAGQRFNATLRPGTELFQYAMSLTEPHLFDTDYTGTVAGQFRQRIYDLYDEERFGGSVRVGRQFGDIWSLGVQSRVERVTLRNIDPTAPTEIFRDRGPDVVTALGLAMTRSTIPFRSRPGRGSRLELSYDRYGALGGDFSFNAVNAEYVMYFTVDEDFLGRATTLRLASRVGYIWGGRAPTYERFYLGGRALRGFEFRTVSPKGIRADNGQPTDEPVGGTWLAFLGAQYEVPIFDEAFTGVIFVDSGTVTDSPGFDDWRVAAGVGIRLYIPQFGNVPIAFDFAIPILKQDGDEEQIVSFAAELPF